MRTPCRIRRRPRPTVRPVCPRRRTEGSHPRCTSAVCAFAPASPRRSGSPAPTSRSGADRRPLRCGAGQRPPLAPPWDARPMPLEVPCSSGRSSAILLLWGSPGDRPVALLCRVHYNHVLSDNSPTNQPSFLANRQSPLPKSPKQRPSKAAEPTPSQAAGQPAKARLCLDATRPTTAPWPPTPRPSRHHRPMRGCRDGDPALRNRAWEGGSRCAPQADRTLPGAPAHSCRAHG